MNLVSPTLPTDVLLQHPNTARKVMGREAERLRELAKQVSDSQPEHAAACVFAAAMIESMMAGY